MADDDKLTAAMTLIRAREEAATRGPWLADVLTDGGDRPVVILPDPGDGDGADLLFSADAPYVTEADAEFVAHARDDVPRLLAAVEAARAHHQPVTTANGFQVCPWCSKAAGQAVDAPCPEVRDITAALTGEETSDGS